MNDDAVELVEGAAEVVAKYGSWSPLHDGRVLSVSMNCESNTIEIAFDLCDFFTENPLEQTTKLTLRWHEIKQITLSTDNLDGVLYEMKIIGSGKWIDTAFTSTTGGLSGSIRARRVEVVSFVTIT